MHPGARLRTAIYVDGFNLYYRAFKDTRHKWLDQRALYRELLRPENDIQRIRYFTAMISGKRDPGAPIRQQAYLRALGTTPEVSIHLGRFLVAERWAAIAAPSLDLLRPSPVTVRVVKTEEKGVATFLRHLTPSRLAAAQFPESISGGQIRKPTSW